MSLAPLISRKRGERIPQALWCAVVDLARDHEMEQIAQALQIDWAWLNRRLDSAKAAARTGRNAIKLVELITQRCCDVRVHRGNGEGGRGEAEG